MILSMTIELQTNLSGIVYNRRYIWNSRAGDHLTRCGTDPQRENSSTAHQLMCCVRRDCFTLLCCSKTIWENLVLKRISESNKSVFFFFVLLLSSKNYSVYYSTKNTYTRWTLLHRANEHLIHFWACKTRSPAVSIQCRKYINMFNRVITYWISDFRTSHNAENL